MITIKVQTYSYTTRWSSGMATLNNVGDTALVLSNAYYGVEARYAGRRQYSDDLWLSTVSFKLILTGSYPVAGTSLAWAKNGGALKYSQSPEEPGTDDYFRPAIYAPEYSGLGYTISESRTVPGAYDIETLEYFLLNLYLIEITHLPVRDSQGRLLISSSDFLIRDA